MKEENKTLAELYHEGPKHDFGDISLVIENRNGKLIGKFIFHHIEVDNKIIKKSLIEKGLPECFSNPPNLVTADVVSGLVWDAKYQTLGEIIPAIEKEIKEYDLMMHNLGARLSLCANCLVFERCYRIAEFALKRRQLGDKRIMGNWSME